MVGRETELIPHYNRHLRYYSPLNDGAYFQHLLKALEVPLTGPVLDVGCGTGKLVPHLHGLEYHGIDFASDRIEEARRLHPEHRFTLGTWQNTLPALGATYGTAVLIEILEHVEDPPGLIDATRACVRPGGWIVGTVPIDLPYRAHLQVWRTAADAVEALQPDRHGILSAHLGIAYKVE